MDRSKITFTNSELELISHTCSLLLNDPTCEHSSIRGLLAGLQLKVKGIQEHREKSLRNSYTRIQPSGVMGRPKSAPTSEEMVRKIRSMRANGMSGHYIEKTLKVSYRRVREALVGWDGELRKIELQTKKEGER